MSPDKEYWKAGTMVYPLPAVLVSCGTPEHSNFLTVAWTGTLCTDPPLAYVSIRPERYSHGLIREHMEFTINLTTEAMARATDWAGCRSGRDYDKWRETGLTPMPGHNVACPMIAESPVSIECRVRDIISLGSHDMFVGQVLGVAVTSALVEPDSRALRLDTAGLISYSHGGYFTQGHRLGGFGWSVKKNK